MNKKDDPPMFSVIIPAHNAELTLGLALESLLHQTRKPDEIWVVDDGSTDQTPLWEHKIKDPSIRWVRRLKNGGAAQARNTGIERAQGKYIAFLDADDVWHPDKLFLLEDLLMHNPAIKFLYHDHLVGDQDFPPIPTQTTLYQYGWVKLLYRNPMATSSVLVEKDSILPFRRSMRYMEDFDLWLRLSEKTPLYYLPITLTRIGRPIGSKGGISAQKWNMRKGEIKAYTYMSFRRPLRLPLLPFLWTYSFVKHFGKLLWKR